MNRKNELVDAAKDDLTEIAELNAWLMDNVSHPDFDKKTRARNGLLVKISNTKQKLENLSNGNPECGYSDNISISQASMRPTTLNKQV